MFAGTMYRLWTAFVASSSRKDIDGITRPGLRVPDDLLEGRCKKKGSSMHGLKWLRDPKGRLDGEAKEG